MCATFYWEGVCGVALEINKKHFQLNLIGSCSNLIDKRKCLAINVEVFVHSVTSCYHVVTVLWELNTELLIHPNFKKSNLICKI